MSQLHNKQARRPLAAAALLLSLTVASSSWRLASAILVQPHNYLLDDSALTNQHDASGSLSPFLNDAQANAEQQDKDIVSIISDSLTRLRLGRMLDQQHEQEQAARGQLSAEMAELLSEQQAKAEAQAEASGEPASLSSSVASLLMNAAQAAAAASEEQSSEAQQAGESAPQMSQRGQIMELDTSQAQGPQAAAQPSKADLKQPIQWYNPKETIPVLKISSMATPSKYKKVYFRSEKKLVDGAFHSPGAGEQLDSKKSAGLALKSFGHSASSANVQRRSSRGSGSAAPPSVLQDGVIDFLKKFRDVYVQTRPAGSQASAASAPSSPLNFASSMISAAASSPLASLLAPASSAGRPNLMGALSTASQMMSGAQALAQAASPAASGSAAPSSGAGSSAGASAATAATSGAAAAAQAAKPLTAQSYVSFWSKTFPTWVRKMLKQMRRRSLYNSSKRQQHQQQHAHHHAIGQKSAGVSGASLASDSNSSSSSQASSSASSMS